MWFRLYAHRFGSTNLTFLLVLVSFIGGLALGALASRRLSRALVRWPGLEHPMTMVGCLELGIACTALVTLMVDPTSLGLGGAFPYQPDSRGFYQPILWLNLETVLAAGGMLASTFLMGTTFPILCHTFRNYSTFPSELYAWNTLGACTGVLIAEFLLLPYLGHTQAFLAMVVANAALGAAFLRLARHGLPERTAGADGRKQSKLLSTRAHPKRKWGNANKSRSRRKQAAAQSPAAVFNPTTLFVVAGMSGFISGGLEVDMFRAVRFAGAISDAAMSFTSFWAIVAIFVGAWTVRSLGNPKPLLLRTALLGGGITYAVTWYHLQDVRSWFNQRFIDWASERVQETPDIVHAASVYPFSGSLLLLFAFTGVVVFPAYYLVSLLLPTICNILQGGREHLGRVYGVNTLAFCVGAVVFTWAAPAVSLFYAVKLLFAFVAIGAILALTFRVGQPISRPTFGLAVLCAIAATLVVPRGFDRRFFSAEDLPARYPVRAMKSNATHTTYVVEDPAGDMLFFDSHPMSGTGPLAQRYMRLMAHVPLLSQNNPRDVLLICFGVGNTASAVVTHESVTSIDIVDLNVKVFETADEFVSTNRAAHRDPRVRLIHDDGRRFLARTSQTYDLITSEPPPPRAAGVYRLYSVEYYRTVLEHLTPEGVMTQWLPVNALSGEAADRVIASFVQVFPHVLLFTGSDDQLILMGGRQPFEPAILERRFVESTSGRMDLARIGVSTPLQIFARIMRMDDALRSDVERARAISDERNDLAHTVTDPFDPPTFAYEPHRVLRQLRPSELAVGSDLKRTLASPERLRAVVPDFPFQLVPRTLWSTARAQR